MKFAAIPISVALIPIAAVGGYFAHQEPGLPAFGQYALEKLNVRHVPGRDSDDWLAVAVTGPNKGGSMDLLEAYMYFPTHADIEENAQGKVKYYELECANYATNADKNLYSAPLVVRKCTSTERTRKQADQHMNEVIQQTS